MKKIFFDTEFSGLHQNTTLISIGFYTECGKTFYAELTDFDKNQIDEWLQNNVINNLTLTSTEHYLEYSKVIDQSDPNNIKFRGTMPDLKVELEKWFLQFDKVQIWSDCLSYDWVLFNQIFGHAFNIPKNVYYIPFDICTMFHINEIDPDINRELFAGVNNSEKKHNALWDAEIIYKCFTKLCLIEKAVKKLRIKNGSPIIRYYDGYIILAQNENDFKSKVRKIQRADTLSFYTLDKVLSLNNAHHA